jgi:NADPH:quinone reductase-like Zn-dependent oxidoreductase
MPETAWCRGTEYACVPADNLVSVPANLSVVDAADAHRHPHPQQRTRRPLARPLGRIVKARVLSGFTRQQLKPLVPVAKRQDLLTWPTSSRPGQVMPVIDRTCPLDEAADALRYVGAGHTLGKVVVTV